MRCALAVQRMILGECFMCPEMIRMWTWVVWAAHLEVGFCRTSTPGQIIRKDGPGKNGLKKRTQLHLVQLTNATLQVSQLQCPLHNFFRLPPHMLNNISRSLHLTNQPNPGAGPNRRSPL